MALSVIHAFSHAFSHPSCKKSLQEPPWFRRLALVEALAIDPDAHAVAAFDTEIIARQRAPFFVPPPFHGDAFGALDAGDIMRHPPPLEAYGRSIRHFRDRLDGFWPREQADRPDRAEAILLDHLHGKIGRR